MVYQCGAALNKITKHITTKMTEAQFEGIITGNAATPKMAADTISSGLKEKVSELGSMAIDDVLNMVVTGLVHFTIRLAIAIVIFYIGRFIINKLHKLVATIFIKRDIDRALTTFVLSLIRIVLYFILLVIVINILGLETSSFLAIFASAGVAIGLALSGTLQNFAGGVLILLLKPYKIGDYIEAQGYSGTVKEIQIFSTILTTPDNKQILIPNGGLSTGSINNYSKEDYRRVDWTISIAYGDDVTKAREVILDILFSDPRIVQKYVEDDREQRLIATEKANHINDTDGNIQTILPEKKKSLWYRLTHKTKKLPNIGEIVDTRHKSILAQLPKTDCSPMVALNMLNTSSIDLTVRAWTASSTYWSVFFDMNERFYKELPLHGINFPFPQLDVRVQSQPEIDK